MIPTQNAPIIFVVGPAGHGKTTVRKMICDKTGLKGDSTSNVLFAILELLTGTSEDEYRKMPKDEIRPMLVELGDVLTQTKPTLSSEFLNKIPEDRREDALAKIRNLAHPSTLTRHIFLAGGSVIDGVRRPAEFFSALTFLAWAGYNVITIWVENPGFPVNEVDNFSLSRAKIRPQFIIENDGSLDSLEQHVEKILTSLGWAPKVAPGEPVILNSKGNPALVDEPANIVTN